MTLSPAKLGFIRGLGMTVLLVVLTYIGDASHLSGWLSVGTAAVISSLALSLENYLASKGETALFGSVNKK